MPNTYYFWGELPSDALKCHLSEFAQVSAVTGGEMTEQNHTVR
jgi:hypothetical protein